MGHHRKPARDRTPAMQEKKISSFFFDQTATPVFSPFNDPHSKPARTPVCRKTPCFSSITPQSHRHHLHCRTTIARRTDTPVCRKKASYLVLDLFLYRQPEQAGQNTRMRTDALFFQFYRLQPHRHHLPFWTTIANRPENLYATKTPWFSNFIDHNRTDIISPFVEPKQAGQNTRLQEDALFLQFYRQQPRPDIISLFRRSIASHRKILYLERKQKNPTLISSHQAVLVLNFMRPSPRYGYQIQRRIMQ